MLRLSKGIRGAIAEVQSSFVPSFSIDHPCPLSDGQLFRVELNLLHVEVI